MQHEPIDESPRHQEETPIPQPPGSTVRLEIRPGEMTIEIPPAGLVHGTRGLFFFAMLWCGFMVVFSAIWIPAWLFGSTDWFVAFFVLPFWAVGVGLLLGAINMGRRHTIIDIVGDALLITRKGIFGVKQDETIAEDIERIHVGPSGMAINNTPINHLRIERRSAAVIGLLTERQDAELRWIAYELRQALRVPG